MTLRVDGGGGQAAVPGSGVVHRGGRGVLLRARDRGRGGLEEAAAREPAGDHRAVGRGEDVVPAGGAAAGRAGGLAARAGAARSVAVRGAGPGAGAVEFAGEPGVGATSCWRRRSRARFWRRSAAGARAPAGAARAWTSSRSSSRSAARRCRRAFAELLGRMADEADVHVLLVMRDDFLFRCHDHPALAPIFSDLTPLGPPTGSALRRALVQPALLCGYRFEDESLADEMLRRDRGRARGAAAAGVRGGAAVGAPGPRAGAADARGLRADRRRVGRAGAARGGDARADRDGASADRARALPQPGDRAGDARGGGRRGAALGVRGPGRRRARCCGSWWTRAC